MVKWTKPAKQDLKAVYIYIKKDSEYYAKKVANEIVDKSEFLNEFPQMGKIVPEINDPNIREIYVYSYRLIYEILNNKISILALIHGRRNFQPSDLESR